jgi:hypothetical protein
MRNISITILPGILTVAIAINQSSTPNAFTIRILTKHLNAFAITAAVKNAASTANSSGPRFGTFFPMLLVRSQAGRQTSSFHQLN